MADGFRSGIVDMDALAEAQAEMIRNGHEPKDFVLVEYKDRQPELNVRRIKFRFKHKVSGDIHTVDIYQDLVTRTTTLILFDKKDDKKMSINSLPNEDQFVDLVAFVRNYTHCPIDNLPGLAVPLYDGVAFNTVEVEYKDGKSIILGGVEIRDESWTLVDVTSISRFHYESCTGSEVWIRLVDGRPFVVHTKNVGLRTYRSLRAAKYTGPVDRRPYFYLTCPNGHRVEVEGLIVRSVNHENCPRCSKKRSMMALNQTDAMLLEKVDLWWKIIGSVNFPMDIEMAARGEYIVKGKYGPDLKELLRDAGIPIDEIDGFTYLELMGIEEARHQIRQVLDELSILNRDTVAPYRAHEVMKAVAGTTRVGWEYKTTLEWERLLDFRIQRLPMQAFEE